MKFDDGSVQQWARDYLLSQTLSFKLDPPALSLSMTSMSGVAPIRVAAPGRPPELRVSEAKSKRPSDGALRDPKKRAALLHTFLHHELQAAELMCWAVLAFPQTPFAFKRGLLAICHEEARHMRMYAAHIEALGSRVGEFPVRDWFWARVPSVSNPSEFVAVMGLGFEGGNLDHTRRFAELFRAVGDEEGARIQEVVAREEVPHVAFAAHWFRVFQGELSFHLWAKALPKPLSPMLMRGEPLDREARREAGFDDTFLDALEKWQPVLRGS